MADIYQINAVLAILHHDYQHANQDKSCLVIGLLDTKTDKCIYHYFLSMNEAVEYVFGHIWSMNKEIISTILNIKPNDSGWSFQPDPDIFDMNDDVCLVLIDKKFPTKIKHMFHDNNIILNSTNTAKEFRKLFLKRIIKYLHKE